MNTIKSQPLKWHGGKSYLAKWIHSLAPPSVADDSEQGYTHRNIVFGGGLGEFWNWLPIDGISEAVNDSNDELSNFYRELKGEQFSDLQQLLEITPMSQITWEHLRMASSDSSLGIVPESFGDSLARAWWFFVRYRQSRQGLGKDYATPTTRTRRGMNENVSAWLSAVDGLPECHERLKRVEIRNLDFTKFIEKYDHPHALFYCDPPYLHETRSSTGEYGEHEMLHVDHQMLLDSLFNIKGKFMLSGYHSDLYDGVAGIEQWTCHEREIDNKASSQKTKEIKTECVWTNY